MPHFRSFLIVLCLCNAAHTTLAERPNVLVMMVDDLGFSDLGCYGGEIDTPNLDSLAAKGVRFSQFYNTAKCHSSRVSLLTGQYCIAAGDTALSHAVTSAEVFGNAGYFTAMTGKWHLKQEPTDFGFQRYFGHLSGACNYFSGDNTFRYNGERWQVPDKGFYTTVANVDYGLKFIQQARQADQPWYLYVAFNAPHAPLHALPQDYEKYRGNYDRGWDAVRSSRVDQQKRLGLFPPATVPSPRPDHVPSWDDLLPWQKEYEANRMATLAAMIDRVDQEVGRLIDDLKSNGELENTFILFVSDNGACPYDRRVPTLGIEPTNARDFFGDSTGWSWARNSPFRYYKQNQFEGGVCTPAIVHWPAGIKIDSGTVLEQPAHLIDVLPTLADITGSEIPTEWKERDLRPLSGVSLHPLLKGKRLADRPPIHLLFAQDRGLRDGDWKLVSFRGNAWELYHIAEDRTELHNLADSEPERLKRMVSLWNDMAKNVLHAPTKARLPVKPSTEPHRHPEWTNFSATQPKEYTRRKPPSPKKTSSRKKPPNIRARKNTTLMVVNDELQLQFSGADPGIAMDLRHTDLSTGPYQLTFSLQRQEACQGEVFFTTDQRTKLPNGTRIAFDISSSPEWQFFRINLPTQKRIHQLRLDVGDGTGSAKIANLQLIGKDQKPLQSWPVSRTSSK